MKTQLALYVCETRGCPFFNVAYEIRENASKGEPLVDDAPDCDSAHGCGKRRARVKGSETPDAMTVR